MHPPTLRILRTYATQQQIQQNAKLQDKFRASTRGRNALVGAISGAFIIGVYGYSLLAVRQENFDDVTVPRA